MTTIRRDDLQTFRTGAACVVVAAAAVAGMSSVLCRRRRRSVVCFQSTPGQVMVARIVHVACQRARAAATGVFR